MNTLGIYIHIPFCAKKCGYCNFYSVCFTKKQAELYVKAVLRNIRFYSDREKITDTVYFGGGTPSLLKPEYISEIMQEIKENFVLSENAEVTLEANPNTISPERLEKYLNAGVNRLSIGVQSMNDRELKFLGRTHNAERAEKAVKDAFSVGFENISCDLMTALPYQNFESLEYSINKITDMPVRHISAYILKIEENTPFSLNVSSEIMPDDDFSAEIYLKTVDMLEKNGFRQYEVSNFAKKGYESRHNCRYWKCLDYIGIGSSAHSCYKGKRFAVRDSIEEFVSSPIQNTFITEENPCGFEEYAMLRLRLKEGLDLSETGERRVEIEKKIPVLVSAGYADFSAGKLSLTAKGFLMSNSVIEYLIF